MSNNYLFEIKQNDRLPVFLATLQDDSGTAIDLTGCTAKLYVRNSKDVLIISENMTIVSAEDGQLSYSWSATDTIYHGEFQAEIEITYTATEKTLTFPTSDYINITIYPDLGPEA